RDWLGLTAGAALTALFIMAARVPVRKLAALLLPFSLFVAISVIVSGVQWGGFDLSAATTTLFELLKMVVIMAAGIALSLATSHLQMKQGLERALSMLRPVRFPVQAVSLMA